MIVEIIPADGIGKGRPIVLAACQVVVKQNNGTPICVAAEYGPDRCQAVAKVGDDDFQRTLYALGIHQTVICDTLSLSKPPPGARLIAGPKP